MWSSTALSDIFIYRVVHKLSMVYETVTQCSMIKFKGVLFMEHRVEELLTVGSEVQIFCCQLFVTKFIRNRHPGPVTKRNRICSIQLLRFFCSI